MQFVQLLFQAGDRDLPIMENTGGKGGVGTPFGQYVGDVLRGSGSAEAITGIDSICDSRA